MKYVELVVKRVSIAGRNIGAVFLLAVVAIMCANVLYRAIGGIIPGTFDLVELFIVPAVGFALITVEFQRRHTVVDMIVVFLSSKARSWLDLIVSLVSLFYWAALCWAGYKMLIRKMAMGETTPLLKLSIIPYRMVWVFTLAWICIIVFYSILKIAKEIREVK